MIFGSCQFSPTGEISLIIIHFTLLYLSEYIVILNVIMNVVWESDSNMSYALLSWVHHILLNWYIYLHNFGINRQKVVCGLFKKATFICLIIGEMFWYGTHIGNASINKNLLLLKYTQTIFSVNTISSSQSQNDSSFLVYFSIYLNTKSSNSVF